MKSIMAVWLVVGIMYVAGGFGHLSGADNMIQHTQLVIGRTDLAGGINNFIDEFNTI